MLIDRIQIDMESKYLQELTMERSKLIQELFKTTTDTEIISAVETIRNRSLGSNDDPIVVIVGFDGGWSNLETVEVTRHEISISSQTDLPFSDE